MIGCPWLKAVLVRSAILALSCRPPADARLNNGFRMFSRRIIDSIVIESDRGFSYRVELLVKCHRLGWPIAEVPARWIERRRGNPLPRLALATRVFALVWLRLRHQLRRAEPKRANSAPIKRRGGCDADAG